MRPPREPFRIKMVEPVRSTIRAEREQALEHAADAAAAVLAERDEVQGLELVSEAPVLPHFTARFRPVDRQPTGRN